MPKIPRDVSGRDLAKALSKYGYQIVRQTGSHIRLVSKIQGTEHKITIPDHDPLKVGTFNAILNDVSNYLKISKKQLLEDILQVLGI
jgi:predicted RNA binding protein YcfA (HicA-like mRNA interferase family)